MSMENRSLTFKYRDFTIAFGPLWVVAFVVTDLLLWTALLVYLTAKGGI